MLGLHAPHHGRDILPLGHIHRRSRRLAALGDNARRNSLSRRAIEVRHVNERTLRRERLRGCPPDAVAGARHQRDLVPAGGP